MSSITFGQESVATVSVSPSSVSSPVYENLTISVNVSGVNDLYGYEFILAWNTTLLVAVNVTEGPFLEAGGGTSFFTYSVNATSGSLTVDSTLTGNVNGVNGDGTLATVTFYINDAGSCYLHLSEATLVDSQDNQIPCQTADGYGYFAVVSAVTTTKTVVFQGYSNGINVTVVNNSGNTETFNVTVYADTTALGNQETDSLSNGTFALLNFTWSTTGFAYGNYTISAYAGPVQGEADQTNFTISGNWVIVSMVGDLTGPNGWPDGKVDIRDVNLVGKAYGSFGPNYYYQGSPPSLNWNPNADINNDGKVDIKDIHIVAIRYGQTS